MVSFDDKMLTAPETSPVDNLADTLCLCLFALTLILIHQCFLILDLTLILDKLCQSMPKMPETGGSEETAESIAEKKEQVLRHSSGGFYRNENNLFSLLLLIHFR